LVNSDALHVIIVFQEISRSFLVFLVKAEVFYKLICL
jgi:hypothetical protein